MLFIKMDMNLGIDVEYKSGIAIVCVNRPGKRNALDGKMFDCLAGELRRAQGDARVRCIVVIGAGPHFSSGHDLAEFATLWPQGEDGAVRRCMHAFAEQSKPVVMAVTGAAVGFGATMSLHADWICAGESAYFKFPFTDIGIVPEAGATALLARRVGDLVARDWLFSARRVSASEALRHGLISSVVPDSVAKNTALEYALRLAEKSSEALQATKRLLQMGRTMTTTDAIDLELNYLNALIPKISRSSGEEGS